MRIDCTVVTLWESGHRSGVCSVHLRRSFKGSSAAMNDEADCVDTELLHFFVEASNEVGPLSTPPPKREVRLSRSNERDEERLARRALVARESRKRKKEYVQQLEDKVARLEAQKEELQLKIQKMRQGSVTKRPSRSENDRRCCQDALMQELNVLLKKESKSQHDLDAIKDKVRQFIENSRERQEQADAHLDDLERRILPSVEERVALWMLTQEDAFYLLPGFWKSFVETHLGLRQSQIDGLSLLRQHAQRHKQEITSARSLARDLRGKSTRFLDSLHHATNEILRILSPEQLATFYQWVETNKWCMQMLDSI